MSEMNCKQYRAVIEESGTAAGDPSARAASHAAACADCRDFGDEMRALRGLVAGLARVDAPADFGFRLRARMAAADSARARPWSRNLQPRAAWLLAAVGCLALAAALALQTSNSWKPAAPETAAQPAGQPAAANPVETAGAETAARNVTGGKIAEPDATRATATPALSDVAVAAQRRARGESVAAMKAVERSQRKQAATAAAQPATETVASSGGGAAQMETTTSSMTAGPIIVSSAIPLPVSAGERPLQVLFQDTKGAAHVVNVDPVAFGSNEPAARPTNVTFTKATKKQGVW
ncbi:MAG TPA: hypothetical protein VK421_07855 [Pyrinomonadaceae bacterium]|nr:hypothetical protein [Pyrinomonadaceae bacterium]